MPNNLQDGVNQHTLDTYWNLTQKKFYASDRCQDARRMLQDLVDSTDYETTSKYFDTDLTFSERHLEYLSKRPSLDIQGYISNLRLMTRKRQ